MRELENYSQSFKFNFTKKDITKSNNNEYLSIDYDNLLFIRNFCSYTKHIDIDEYYSQSDLINIHKNIFENKDLLYSNINNNVYSRYSKAIIFRKDPLNIIDKFKNDYLIIGIHESLKKFADIIDIYASNDYSNQVLNFLPENNKRWPQGLFSYKINNKFLKYFKGPKNGFNFPFLKNSNGIININKFNITLEDHRNIVLSILNLIYILGIREVILYDVFNYQIEEKPSIVYINDSVYMYPQQIIDTSIISAGTYWLSNYGTKVHTLDENIDFINTISVSNTSEIF